jgi:iron-sulfur cluster assembly protein
MSTATKSQQQGLQVTDGALAQLKLLRDQQAQDLCLRVGVRQGGCSGMSYTMDFIESSSILENDDVFDYDGFQLVCDRKSLLYIYGLVLDYSNSMIGGGFQFTNPNASQTCGCGKSFAV